MLQTKTITEEDLVFRLAQFFSDIDCHELFSRCKRISYSNNNLMMTYEHTSNPLNLIYADISISDVSLLLSFTNVDYRVNRMDPYFVSYSFVSEYSETEEKFLKIQGFNTLSFEDETMLETEIINKIKSFNKQIQCS